MWLCVLCVKVSMFALNTYKRADTATTARQIDFFLFVCWLNFIIILWVISSFIFHFFIIINKRFLFSYLLNKLMNILSITIIFFKLFSVCVCVFFFFWTFWYLHSLGTFFRVIEKRKVADVDPKCDHEKVIVLLRSKYYYYGNSCVYPA